MIVTLFYVKGFKGNTLRQFVYDKVQVWSRIRRKQNSGQADDSDLYGRPGPDS